MSADWCAPSPRSSELISSDGLDTPASGTPGVEVKQGRDVHSSNVDNPKAATPAAVPPITAEPPQSRSTPPTSRKLGITPTEVNLGDHISHGSGGGIGVEGLSLPSPATERLLNSGLVEPSLKSATPPLGKTVSAPPAANPFKVPQQAVRKPADTATKSAPSVTALTAEMMQRLDQAGIQEEERRAKGVSSGRAMAQRSVLLIE